MPGISPTKGLYLAKSIEELQKQGSVPSQKPDLLVKVSQKLLTNAKECEINGDQEKAYVLFFKYCELAKTIRRSLEYKKDKLYYDSMVSSKSVKDAVDHLDSLAIVLNERYEEKEKREAFKTLKNNFKKLEIENRRLEVENQNLKDSRICIICMDEEISQVFLPCGHAICCKNCINNIQKCPACRANVQNSVMLYFK